MKNFIAIFTLVLFAITSQAQVTIKLNSQLDVDTLLLGYFYGKNQFVADSAFSTDGTFIFEDDRNHKGLYFIYMPDMDVSLQLLMDGQKNYDVELKADTSLAFANSAQNTAFYNYIGFLNNQRDVLSSLNEGEMDSLEMVAFRNDLDEAVVQYQESIMAEYQDSLLGTILNLNKSIDIPDFDATGEDLQNQRYTYYVNHYFDHMNLKDNRMIYVPGFYDKIKKYVDKYTRQEPDSIILAVDRILRQTDLEGPLYKYLVIDFLNTYANSEIIGMDAIYVHLVQEYYAQGKAPWVKEEQLEKIIEEANKIDGILIGKTAPDIDMQLKDGTKVSLHDLDSDFTILFFWTPECSHCRKSIPDLIENFQAFKDRGVELFAVCTELTTNTSKCWEFIDEHPEMVDFINVVDPYLRSDFKKKYDVFSTPQFFLLDADKKIIMKRFSVEQMPSIVEHFLSETSK